MIRSRETNERAVEDRQTDGRLQVQTGHASVCKGQPSTAQKDLL